MSKDFSTEAEYMALSEVVKELKFIVRFLQTMNIEVELPITVYVDNGPIPELCITFHLQYITFALHLKNLPRQHEMHDMSRFKCHALHLHFMN